MRVAWFSGGDDSLAATALAFERGLVDAVLHTDTTIAAPATRAFVEQTCAEQAWPLYIYAAPVGYRALVLEHGFPGPAVHSTMYYRLKERTLRAFKAEHGCELLVTGVRRGESARRARWVAGQERKKGFRWHAPLVEWSKGDVLAYIAERDLPRNPVSLTMHLSGDCICGAFARAGEREEWRFWWPEVDDALTALEGEARAAGLSAWRWGHRPADVHKLQLELAHFPECGCS